MPLSWANVTTDGKMPWDATGFPRQLSIPEPLASKAWKGSAQKAVRDDHDFDVDSFVIYLICSYK